MKFLTLGLLTCAVMLMSAITPVVAQSVCSSDGQTPPVRVLERFTSADCATCWSEPATTLPRPETVVLDWVLPGAQGDEAALSAVAIPDALLRLEALGQRATATANAFVTPIIGHPSLARSTLRVARGLALSGYIGASIELKPGPRATSLGQLTAWLALVEILPVGLEGSSVERHLVRNVFQSNWNLAQKLSEEELAHWFDQRSMSVMQGVNSERLQVIGWLADSKNRVLAASQSRCVAAPSAS